MTQLTFRRHDAHQTRRLIDLAVRIHAEVYAEPLFRRDPYFGDLRVRDRIVVGSRQPRFELITAEADGEVTGYLCGWALPAYTRWWSPLRNRLPGDVITETGDRTVYVQEILVRRPWRGQGIARRLHDDFLAGRTEERGLICVQPHNETARAAYLRWGWDPLARVRFATGEPEFECLLKSLHPAPAKP
jgi:ribosomal protein S18 acetylase RimI-like enzyme